MPNCKQFIFTYWRNQSEMGGRGTFRRQIRDFDELNRLVGRGGGGGATEYTSGGGGRTGQTDPRRFSDRTLVSFGRGSSRALQDIFGRRISARQVGRLVGAPDGSVIRVRLSAGGGGVVITTTSPLFSGTQTRTITGSAGMGITVNNARFALSPSAPSGFGLAVFARQVAGASDLGVSRIVAQGSRGLGNASFNTLALLGFNGTPSGRAFAGVSQISSLMTSAEGRQAWRTSGNSFEGVFDVRRGSVSRTVFDALMRSRREES